MYSGTTFRRNSGRFYSVHRKIDRAARNNLNRFILKSIKFPGIRSILYFESKNGPDGLMLKGSKKDDPWHHIDPSNNEDRAILTLINDHIFNLSEALKNKNSVRASFEAAWLAHAVTDGLTPAHHYALDDKIQELWGKSHFERQSVKEKGIIRGKNRRDTISKNWEYWGAGGIFTTHHKYEMGVASTIAPVKFDDIKISKADIDDLINRGFEALFMESVYKIYNLNIYDTFVKSGLTVNFAIETREVLIPEIIKMVILAWYQAAFNAKGTKI